MLGLKEEHFVQLLARSMQKSERTSYLIKPNFSTLLYFNSELTNRYAGLNCPFDPSIAALRGITR
jgi:hypothetical protein